MIHLLFGCKSKDPPHKMILISIRADANHFHDDIVRARLNGYHYFHIIGNHLYLQCKKKGDLLHV